MIRAIVATGRARLALAFLCLGISACGGGGGGDGGGGGVQGGGAPDKLALALASGDVAGLGAADRDTLLKQATDHAAQLQRDQAGLLAGLYSGVTTSLALNHTTNSISLTPMNSAQAAPFIVADDGSGMATVSTVGAGRALAYGADVLAWMAGTTREQQHLPLFTRAFTWLITGAPGGSLPASIRYATHGYSGTPVQQFIARLGRQAVAVACDVSVANTCWQGVDLMVFGSGSRNDPELTALVRQYLAAGKAVIYLHPNWINADGGRRVLTAMGVEMDGYPGNFFASAAGVSVGADRTVADSLRRADVHSSLVRALQLLARNDVVMDFAADPEPADAITRMHNELGRMQEKGMAVFGADGSDLHRKLVLWADLWRLGVDYVKLSRTGDADEFLRAYASDSWLVFNRAATTVAPNGAGDYMPKAAQALAVSPDWESLPVTIAQNGGITAIGRGAVPGKPVTIEVESDDGVAELAIQTSYVRAWGNPLTDAKYERPRRPHSFAIPIAKIGPTVFVSPAGGPLFLSYSGAAPGKTVRLRIKGVARYAHFDFTRATSAAEIDEAVAALKRRDFGWQTAKFEGGEIQQTVGKAFEAIGALDPKVYVLDRIKSIIFDTNHIANGYRNMPLAATVAQRCAQLGWDCEGPMHRAPGVQHFVGWIAACGYLCSGNPADGFPGVDLGWGWAHELGHNTVQRSMTMTFGAAGSTYGCVVECNNNVLASAQMLRKYALLGEDSNGDRTHHAGLYEAVRTSRATGKTGDALVQDMHDRLWRSGSPNAMQAVHYQLAFLYTRHVRGLAQPSMESALEFMSLLTKGDRLVAQAWDPANKARYGMGRFADNKIANADLIYVLSSRIIGRDLRAVFELYGVPLSATALGSIADLALPLAPPEFYALPAGQANRLALGRWLDLQTGTPAWPF